jgi:hypothetical protein
MSDPAGKKGKTAVRLPENLGDILAGGLGASLKDWQNLQTHIKRIVESMTANMPPAFKAAVAPTVGLPSPESFNCLRSVAMLMKFQLDPSSVDERRGKKRSCFTEDQALLRTCAIDAFRLNKIEYIMPWLEKAVATRNPEIFKVLAQVVEETKAPSHSTSSRRVTSALQAEIRLLKNLGRIPTKQEIRLESGLDLEPSRWTEIHKAAGQANNPAGKPKRGQERRGGNKLRTRPPK